MVKTARASIDQYAMFEPHSSWVMPTELPDLSHETEIAIDTEERDDSLKRNEGPGFHKFERGNSNTGFICGISCAWRDQSVYIPLRHDRKRYFDHGLVQRWLKSLAAQKHTRFIFHNFQYDWGWLQAEFDIQPPDNIDDTGCMASMVDENQPSFSLDNLCKWQGLPGKEETLLIEWGKNHGIRPDDIKQYIWESPIQYAGVYAEQDASQTLALAGKLRPLLEAEKLLPSYQVERDLMPITLKMRQQGIKVDINRATQLRDNIRQRVQEELIQLSSAIGERVTIKEIRQNRWMKEQFEKQDLKYPRTAPTEGHEEGQASFEKSFMQNHPHWFPRHAFRIKHMNDVAEKFIDKYIIRYAHKGRIYPTVNQFRSEGGGARSHRFSYADPPLQQTPSRDDEWAPLVRSCFIPEDGEEWCSIDWRQQEYRLIVLVAELLGAPGARATAEQYRNDPNTDFHDYVAAITGLKRRRAKDVNFATAYGAGVRKFALMTGMDEEEASATMGQYHEKLPFVKVASNHYAKFAAEAGYIKLIDGARNHFNLWEPSYRDYAKEYEYKKRDPEIDTTPCYEEEAERRRKDPKHPWYWEKMKRSFTHKAFNRTIQGSAARQMKKGMVDVYHSGYLPLIQMHDELGFSFGSRHHGERCAEILEHCMPIITIPMPCDVEWGPNWGNLKK